MEEDQANRRARKKAGGNSGKRYTEGWVEFEDKKIARGVYDVYVRKKSPATHAFHRHLGDKRAPGIAKVVCWRLPRDGRTESMPRRERGIRPCITRSHIPASMEAPRLV